MPSDSSSSRTRSETSDWARIAQRSAEQLISIRTADEWFPRRKFSRGEVPRRSVRRGERTPGRAARSPRRRGTSVDDLGVARSVARLALYGVGAQSGSLSQVGVCVTCSMLLPSAFIV
jgi:hypothetical protein